MMEISRPRRPMRVSVSPSGFPAQPSHDLIELVEVTIADVHDAPGIAVIDADGKPERVADASLQCGRVGILYLAAPRLLRLALRHALDMGQRFGLAHVETLFDDALGGGEGVGHADQCPGVAGR